MNNENLLKLVQTLITLKEVLKCPICLEVMQEVLELNCGHKYCVECYTVHKSTQKLVSCPICKRILKRRSIIYKDIYASSLGQFVYNLCKNIQDIYNCEVEQLQLTLNRRINTLPQGNADILKKNGRSRADPMAASSTSTINKQRDRSNISKERCEDSFDKLMNSALISSTFNRKNTRRVYVNKKKVNKTPAIEYNILEFDNYENKTAVLQWLNDTRNLFGRLTQTQNYFDEHTSPPVVDLVSISQEKVNENEFKLSVDKNNRKWRTKSLDIEIKKVPKEAKRYSDGGGSVIIENYDIEDINTEEEEVIKKVEEKILLDLIEDKYLNKLENELQNHQDKDGQLIERNPKKSEKHTNTPNSGISAMGWDRITKIKKTIKKSEKIPKKLNITLQSNQHMKVKNDKNINIQNQKSIVKNDVTLPQPQIFYSSNNFDNIDKLKQKGNTTNEIVKQNEVASVKTYDGIQINESPEVKLQDSIDSPGKNETKTKFYDFNKLEEYIRDNMKIIDKTVSDTSASSLIVPELDKSANKDKELCEEKEHTAVAEKDNEIKLHNINPETNQETDHIDDNLLYMTTKKNLDHSALNKTIENIVVDNNIKDMFDSTNLDAEQICLDITNKANVIFQNCSVLEKMNEDGVIICEIQDNKSDGKEKCVATTNDETGCSYEDILTTVSHNDTKLKETVKNEIFDDDDIEKIYSLPTQTVVHKCKDATPCSEVLESSYSGLFHLLGEGLEKCLINLQSADIQTIGNDLHTLQCIVVKLKSFNKNKGPMNITSINKDNCNASTQTVIEIVNEHTQTEEHKSNVEVQTETIRCLKCNTELNESINIISQNTENVIKSILCEREIDFKAVEENPVLNILNRNTLNTKPPSQNEILTSSFDNLNFETQDITRNQDGRLENPCNDLPKNPSTQNNENNLLMNVDEAACENLPSSVLVCSFDTTNPTTSEKVNCKLNYENDKGKKFKRIRIPSSDSEDEAEAKRKCNRFIRDDLTIEIHTNTERMDKINPTQNPVLESQDSDNINYDDYLVQVMQKYDDNNCSISLSAKKSQAPASPKKVINNIITKCEEMIEQANKNIQKIKVINNGSDDSSKDSFHSASQTLNNNFDVALTADNMFMDENNLLKLEKDIQDYERASVKEHNTVESDIIGVTEELEPLSKKLKSNTIDTVDPQSASLFGPSEDTHKKQQSVMDNSDICKELNINFDDLDYEINEAQTNLNKVRTPQKQKINILRNIKIKSQNKKEEKEVEDDLFSDEDIVETTPQKKVDSFTERSVLSQIDNIAMPPIMDKLPTPLSDTENFEFDYVALPPPPDFQDDSRCDSVVDNISDHEITLVHVDPSGTNLNKLSLTPDKLSQFQLNEKDGKDMSQIVSPCINQYNCKENQVQNDFSLTPDILSQSNINSIPRKIITNTPVTRRDLTRQTLGISPISVRKNKQNSIIAMTQTSKYSPLSSVTKNNPQKHTILTSTPRQKSIWNYVKPSQAGEMEVTSTTNLKPCIACTRLAKEQIKGIVWLTNKKLSTYSTNFDMGVTHMIVSVNENNCVKDHTIKYVSAVAAGIWILRFNWIEECLKNNCIIPEEPFEALDVSGMPGPKTSRLSRNKNRLFNGYKFYCANQFVTTTREQVEDVIKMLEGKVLRDLKDLLEDDGNIGLIITEGHGTQDFEPLIEQYESWAKLYKTATVDIDWFCKCIGQYKLLSIRSHIWCSEDNLGDLGYPSYLTETVPFSVTEPY